MQSQEHAPQCVVTEPPTEEDAAAACPRERRAPLPLLLRPQSGLLQLEEGSEGPERSPGKRGRQHQDGPPQRPGLLVLSEARRDPLPPQALLQVHVCARAHGAPAFRIQEQVWRDRVLPEKVRRGDHKALQKGPR